MHIVALFSTAMLCEYNKIVENLYNTGQNFDVINKHGFESMNAYPSKIATSGAASFVMMLGKSKSRSRWASASRNDPHHSSR